ncbi:MAG: AbrB/MazE/SpoVT family DNA-binding domain-containing protein [Clostridia bacterium]|nr:AbrB/MazE/SpoVT family DNA-binding domain-containing protein [Clostridia bacterium]
MSMARTFTTGRSQAIRIPKEYRLPDEEIFINRVGNTITLTPTSKLKDSFFYGLKMFTDDFMKDGRPPQIESKRDTL